MLPRVIACALFALVGTWQLLPADEFHAGCSIVDVSPRNLPAIRNGGFLEASSDRIDDPLKVRSLALSDGKTTIVLAIVDSCMIPTDVCDAIKQSVGGESDRLAEHILIAATHTHSAPSVMDFCLGSRQDKAYRDQLVDQVARGIVLAAQNLQPARIGWTVVNAPEHTFCRRWLKHPSAIGEDPFGEQTVRAMMHPGYQNPEYLGPAGPVDSQLSLISIQATSGQQLCLFTNYSMHYFGVGSGFSADYFGQFAEVIEKRFEPRSGAFVSAPCVGIMSQGTSGDLHWMNYQEPARSKYTMRQYSEELAEIALGALSEIEYRDSAPLDVAQTRIELGRRVPDAKRLDWARELNAQRGDRRPANLPEVYAEQAQWLAENPRTELVLQAIRIGDLGIAAIPNEVYGITGLKLKAQSPLQPLINIELANGAEGYIPPPEQHALGGYTTWPARTAGLEVDAEPKIVDALLSLLEQLAPGTSRRSLTDDFYNDQQRAAIAAALDAQSNGERHP